MAHGSTHPLITATRWRTTLRRGVILGGVTALHLGSMALLLRPVAPYRSPRAAAHNSEPPLQIHFVILPRQSHRADSPSSRRPAAPPRHATSAPPSAVAVTPAPVTAISVPTSLPTRPDDYRSAALDVAQQNPNMHLPGSIASPRNGIRLRDRPSMRDVVRTMTTVSRCKYEGMKMAKSATQFVTRQLMDRALYADGCGPQTVHTAADSSVDAISRKMIFDD